MAAQKGLIGNEEEESNSKKSGDGDGDGKEVVKKDGWVEHQESLLLKLLASELQVEIEDIVDFELSLFDVQKASLGGVHSGECIKYIIFLCTVPNLKKYFFLSSSEEFIHSARLDNLASCFLAVEALVEIVLQDNFLETDEDINMIVLYDHEEVGSSSA